MLKELQQRCALTSRRDTLLAIGILDLDNLKAINDYHGHAIGDAVLRHAVQSIREVLRSGDQVIRVGGDEFALLVSNVSSMESLELVSERILNALKQPVSVGEGQTVEASASLGWTLYPLDDDEPGTLLRHADSALYRAKQGGKDQFALYFAAEDTRTSGLASPILLLTQALRDESLRLYYQPIVRRGPSGSWVPVAVEALLRIEQNDDSVLTPASFAEGLDHPRLARSLGCFVLETAVQQAVVWEEQSLDLEMSVNVSITHLLDPQFLEDIERMVLQEQRIPPTRLTLEITESARIKDLNAAYAALHQCQVWGIRIALDDFGTGYASLTYLQKFPVNTVKIDQTFVRDILIDQKDRGIVHGILAAARELDISVIAEGVESQDHANMLRAMDCLLLQGFWIGKPMRADNLARWMCRQGLSKSQVS